MTKKSLEDGSAPLPVKIRSSRKVTAFKNVNCGRCAAALKHVFPDEIKNGVWKSLQADDALVISLEGGYGMYIDYMEKPDGHLSVMLCKDCAEWLRKEVPGVDRVIKRLNE